MQDEMSSYELIHVCSLLVPNCCMSLTMLLAFCTGVPSLKGWSPGLIDMTQFTDVLGFGSSALRLGVPSAGSAQNKVRSERMRSGDKE
jgi:hypothetical protein